MDVINILIIVAIIVLAYKWYESFKSDNNTPNDVTQEDKPAEIEETQTESTESTIKIPRSKTKKMKKLKKIPKENPYYTEVQFHTDYRDTQNAFQILVPNQKQLFNRSDLPLINVSAASNQDVIALVKNFIKEVNRTIDTQVADGITPQDWKNSYGERDFKSGWEKQQERLGLPGSIYNNPAKKAHVRLVKVDRAERFETEDEIRFTVYMILQKIGTEDQMVVKVNFVVDKRDVDAERDFFNKEKNSYETKVVIEEIAIEGFLTKNSIGQASSKSKYYEFDGIDINGGRQFSQEEIIKQLNKKRRQYEKECAGGI